jgi:phage-related protein
LAIDVAAGSGKSLEAVSNAIGKAYEGNAGALAKLGVGLSAAELKTMTFDEVTIALSETFAGQATEKAETFAGKMDRLKVAFDEGKETVGSFVLDAITPMVTFFTDNVVPIIQTVAAELGENLKPVFDDLSVFFTETFIPALQEMWAFLNEFIIPIFKVGLATAIGGVKTVFAALSKLVEDNAGFFNLIKSAMEGVFTIAKVLAPFIGGAFKAAFSGIALIISGVSTAIQALVSAINLAISAVNLLIGAYNIVNNITGGKDLPKIPKLAAGGMVSANKPYIVGEVGAELFVPSSSGRIIPNNQLSSGSAGMTVNLTVNGAIDSEGTARTIINALNDSFYRGTGGAGQLQAI